MYVLIGEKYNNTSAYHFLKILLINDSLDLTHASLPRT